MASTTKPATPELHPADVALREAQTAKEKAEAKKLLAEAREADNKAAVAGLMFDREQEKRRRELAGDEHHLVYVFDEAVDDRSVKSCIQQLTRWSRQQPKCDIEIQINSPGGSVFDGFALVDFIRDLREKGHEITMVAYGMAASMAGVILQAADKRAMGVNCLLLIHEGSFGAIGNVGEVEDRVEMMKLLHKRVLALFAERSNLSEAQIARRWHRKDWWLTADTALKHGFIDEIR